MKTFAVIVLTAIITASAAWFAIRQFPAATPASAVTAAATDHKLLHYQCAMHPQVTSGKPGRCTICGMELTPIYEGGHNDGPAASDNLVVLTQNQIQVLHVQSVEATTAPLKRSLRVAGVITEDSTRHRVLAAYVDGRIDKLSINYLGAEVTAGQPLAEYYSPGLLQAEREYRQLSGDLRANTALRLRQMGLGPAQIDALDHKPADALTSQILSPISGTVVAQAVSAGQYVVTGERLFEIADFSTMWFVFRAYEQDLPWLSTGLNVRITTPAIPDQSFAGKITFIDPTLDEATRSANIRVELSNPPVNGKRLLLNRLFADGQVELDAPSVLTVPRSAVLQTGPAALVYIDHGSSGYERRVVKIGRRGDIYQEILSGLKEGERVVTNGNLLIDGQAEMNRAFMPTADAPAADMPITPAPAALNDAQKAAVAAFVKVADALAAALGVDDLPAFNTASSTVIETTDTLIKQLRDGTQPSPALDALATAEHFHAITDLKAARLAFHQFSLAATAVLVPLRKADGMPDFQIYECPMVNQALPGVPNKARWIQTAKRTIANPFFGQNMPDCGEAVEPE
ncbi:MAG: efflux RND transporter periplasmic adaptor subunit [Verrucomicrobiota bacterium]